MRAGTTERILQGLIVICLVALIYFFADAIKDKRIGAGNQAPDFTIRTDSGLTITQSEFGGRLLVLNFWATWCPPCIEEMPSLDQLHKMLKDSGLVVLGISIDEEEEAYRSLLQRLNVSFLTAHDPEAAISSRFGTFRFPETYLITSDGKVIQKIIGAADWTGETMVNYIRSLL